MTLFSRRSPIHISLLAAGCLLALLALLPAQASTVMVFKGILHIERNQKVVPVAVGSVLRESDTLVVEPDGEALLRFRDGANMVLRSDSRVTFEQLVQKGDLKKRKAK